ncbi:MAG: hypothetical protein QOF51_626 [Chloroflexota bacterium]|jgi:hypothetical protein|nr:hypothetical protein [Chloroflexota bacterium]
MPVKLGPITIPWLGSKADDPYWDGFINGPVHDTRNIVGEAMRGSIEGPVNPTKGDVHTPEITSGHIKELATFLGSSLTGVTRLDAASEPDGYPFAIVCAVQAEYDPREHAGVGGQVPVQNGKFVSFVLSAYIRELGFRATALDGPDPLPLAVAAGMGTADGKGRLVTQQLGNRVYLAEVIRTDLPLAPDGEASLV